MFVLLALVFAGGFVFFGVGSGSSIGDLLQGNFNFGGSSSGQPSIKNAEKRIAKNPKDAKAYSDLATAQQTNGDTDAAIATLVRYTQLRPKDPDGLSRLASLYLAKASGQRNLAIVAQDEAQQASAGTILSPGLQLKPGQTLGQDPITEAVSTGAQARFTAALTQLQDTYRQAEGVYKRLVAVQPNDASIQLQLADAAQSASDTPTAIAAYKAFLKLAPDDPSAPIVKQQLKRLQTPAATATAGASG